MSNHASEELANTMSPSSPHEQKPPMNPASGQLQIFALLMVLHC